MGEEKNIKKKYTLFKFLTIIVILLMCISFYAKYCEVRNIRVKEFKIESNKLPDSFDSIKIIHFSDLNYGSTIFKEELQSLVEKVNSYKPDIVIFSGNLIYENYNYNTEDIDFIVSELSKIKATVGKYAVSGVHDNKVEDYDINMSNASFKVLNNNYDLIYYKSYTPIFIGGLSSYLTTKIDVYETLSYFDDKEREKDPYNAEYKIMVVNESDAVDEILNYKDDIDLILSGNTLGGIINVPFYGPLFKMEGSSKYYYDYQKVNNTDLYISSGIGTNKRMLRLFNHPSFNLYRLTVDK